MIIVLDNYLILCCGGCGAKLAYLEEDIFYEDSDKIFNPYSFNIPKKVPVIVCPRCHERNRIM